MQVDIVGRIRNLQLPVTQPLIPLFECLVNSIEAIENDLQMSRRYYNGAARDYNVKVESFPSNLVANQFGFTKAGYFEIADPADRAVPTVKF